MNISYFSPQHKERGCHVVVRVTVQVRLNLLKFSVLFSKTKQMTKNVIRGHKF